MELTWRTMHFKNYHIAPTASPSELPVHTTTSPFIPKMATVSAHHSCEAVNGTLRVSLSGTFLQTVPDLVTALKWYSFISAVGALRKVSVLI